MLRESHISALLTLTAALALAYLPSCGAAKAGRLSTELPTQPGLQSPGQLMAQLNVSGLAVSSEHYKQGAAFDTLLPVSKVEESGALAVYSPSESGGAGLEDLAYACYVFDATSYEGDPAVYLDWSSLPDAGQAWLGLGNFEADRWDYFALEEPQAIELNSLAPYVEENGRVLALVMLNGGSAGLLRSIGLGNASALSLLDAIPAALHDFPVPISYELPAEGELGAMAGRLWMDEDETNLVVVQLSDELSPDEALAAFTEQCAAYGSAEALGDGGWAAQDNQLGGTEGFNLLQFTRGPYLALIGSGVMAPGALPVSPAVLEELADAVDIALTDLAGGAHSTSRLAAAISADQRVDITAESSALPLEAGCNCGPADDSAIRRASATTVKSITLNLEKPAGTKVGTITLQLKITPTEEPCGQTGTDFMTIVDVLIESISVDAGASDGDGAGRGDGDMMVGGNISIGFLGLGGMSSVAMGGFATGEVGDIGEGESSSDDEDSELPKFIGTVKGCGIPKVIDVDLLLRDNDSGTDVQDIVAAAAAAAGEYGAGSETGKRVGAAVDGMGEKPSDASGTDGMKRVRDRDKDGHDEPGDDVGEAHDKQTAIPGD